MTHVTAKDGTRLYVEEHGSGHPILFLHEYAGDHRSWARQVGRFAGTHRCAVTTARGYPPSDVPPDADSYGPDIAAADAVAVMDGLGIERAHVVGLSMGAYTGLLMAMRHPERVSALLAASGGSGSHPADNPTYRAEARQLVDEITAAGAFPAETFGHGPTRIHLKRKNPPLWQEFVAQLAEHDATGAAHVLARYVGARQSLYAYADSLSKVEVPTLLMIGDEDDPVIEINVWLKRTLKAAGLSVWPNSGHLLNLEAPDAFNAGLAAFLQAVETGTWARRGPVAPA